MKNTVALSFALVLVVAGVAKSAITTVTYQVSASADDGYAWSATEQDISSSYLMIGDDRTYTAPYYMSAMRFTNIAIPRSAVIIDARLKISSIDQEYRGKIYGLIQAEAADNPTDFSSRYIGAASKTVGAIDWDHKFYWDKNTQYTSPDISTVVQEIINRTGWNSGNSLAIFYSTRTDSRKSRMFSSFEAGESFAAVLEITYETYSISGYIKTSDNAPIEGVAVSAGADIEGDVTDSTGYYELKVPPGWSGTVTVTKTGWSLSPENRSYSNVSSDQTNQDFTAFQPTISGSVASYGQPLEGVTLTSSNGGGTAVTDSAGSYNLTVAYGWSGTITPSKPQYTFTPVNKVYSNVIADTTSQNYTAILPPVSISGYVRDGSGNGVAGVNITANNGGGNTVTDSAGYYAISVPYGWSGTVTASKAGFNITPQSISYSNVTYNWENQNYSAYQPTISGIITAYGAPFEGVAVTTYSGLTAVTNSAGYYVLAVPYNVPQTITPSKPPYIFTPLAVAYSPITSNKTKNFTAILPPVNISGHVRDGNANGVAGVNITADNGGGTVFTHSFGYYFISVPHNWSGMVTAKRAAWQITPEYYSYNNLTVHQSNQDFTAFYTGIVNVKPDGTGDYPTIQAAIDAAANGDNVILQPGTYTGAGNRDISFRGKAITVRGATGDPNDCVIDCNGTQAEPHRGFKFISGEDTNSVLEAITITNGYGPLKGVLGTEYYYSVGGAIYCRSSSPTVNNCIIVNNSARVYGGGIYNWDHSNPSISNCIFISNSANWGGGIHNNNYSSPTITDCIFSGNNVDVMGGGIYNYNYSNPSINSCIINNNSAANYGGGIFNGQGDPNIDNCIISDNSAHNGGGIYIVFVSSLCIRNCTISDNVAENGGGIYCHGSNPLIDNCIIRSNSSEEDGGGIYNNFNSNPTITNCDLDDNSASDHGGGLYNTGQNNDLIIVDCNFSGNTAKYGGGISNWNNSNSTPSIKNCSFRGNNADVTGGAIHNYKCNPSISNCTINNNSAGFGAAVYCTTSSPIVTNCTINDNAANERGGGISCNYNSSPILTSCIMWANSPEEFDQYNSPGLQVNYSCVKGGYAGIGNINTDPCFIDDYHISAISPCINAGDPNYIAEPNEKDIDGDPRVICKVDMGADEIFVTNSAALSAIPKVTDFQLQGKHSNTTPQTMEVLNYGAYALNWQIEIPNDCNRLIIRPLSGQTPSLEINEISISIDTNNVDYGSSSCQFQVIDLNAVGSPQTVTVNLEVLRPQIGLSETNYYFTAYGKTDDDVADRQLMITNTGYDTLSWQIQVPNDCNWLSAIPQSGQVTDGNSIVILSVDPNKAPQYGYNYCTLQIIDPNASNSPQSVEVRLNVYGPSIYVNPYELRIYAEKDKTAEAAFIITNSGYDILDWTIEVPNDCNWIASVNPVSGACGSYESIEVTVTVDSNGLELGQSYQTQLIIDSPQVSPKNYNIYLEIYEPNEIHVPYDYPTIQEAGDAAQVYGDTIIVHPGKYAGCLIKDKSLTIRSIKPNNPIIVAATIIGSSISIFSRNTSPYIDINGLSIVYDPQMPQSYDMIGIFSTHQHTSVTNCIIKNWPNGGIYVGLDAARSTINNCLIIENRGYGIRSSFRVGYGYKMLIDNCTIAETLPDTYGNKYGIYLHSGLYEEVHIRNSIFHNATSPDDIELYYNSNYSSGSVSYLEVSYSCIPAGSNSVSVHDNAILIYGPGNIETDPCFVMKGYINDNNTPTDSNDDFWVNGDYHLKSQYGCWQPSPFTNMDATGDGFLDMTDFAVLAAEWSKTSEKQTMTTYPYNDYYPYLRADLDNSGKVDINDLMIFCDGYLDYYEQGWWVYDDVTSPCIDAGDPSLDWTAELWPHGKRINMGAYGGTPQASMSLSTVGNKADLNNDGFVNAEDLALFVDMWLAEEVLLSEDINRNGSVNFSDWAEFAGQWLWEE